ncbi:MAG: hypothetical protein BWX47_01917 [candidate division Hyd24-12 bacterium ADurb.Bin004]|nr:MAG: hypothetical protein BWX47_01917 [candidate division Hyd24-12 bacterium ADurb.Bin004]
MRRPTFEPPATRLSTVSWATSAPEHIITSTRSASGAPVYSNRLYARPVRDAKRSIASWTMPGTAR